MYKFFKTNITSLFFLIPIFVLPFLQSKLLLDISLNLRFLALNIFLFVFAVFGFLKFKNKSFLLYFKIYFSYLIYLLINIYLISCSSDAFFQYFLIFCFGLIVFLYQQYFEKIQLKINDFTNIFTLLGFVILIYAFYNYFQVYFSVGISHQSIYEIKACFSHKNILSEILFVLFPFSLFSLINSDIKFTKSLGLLNCIGIIYLVIVLITRAVWLSFIIGFIFTFFSFLLISKKEIKLSVLKKKLTYYYIISGFILVLVSIFIYSKLDNFETIKKSTVKIFSTYDSSQHRLELWNRSIEIFKENPVFGKGLATWKIEVLKYGNQNLQSQDNITFYQRPHNDYLWVLAEQGILGFIFFMMLIILIYFYLIKLIGKSTDSKELMFYWLMFYLIIGYLIFSFFSFPKERVEHNLFLGIIFGFIIHRYNQLNSNLQNISNKNLFYKGILLFLIIILGFSTVFAFNRFISEVHLKKAFEARSKSDWNFVIKEIEKSESFAYQIDPFSTPLKWYSGEANFILGYSDKAFSDFFESFKLNPYHIHVINNLATCYEIKGNHNLAIDYYKKAIKISPKFEDALLNLTAVYYNLHQDDSALFYISKIDTNSQIQKYKLFLQTILIKRIDNLIQAIENDLIVDVLKSIKSDNNWIFNIFVKSKSNCIIFDKQLLKDCLFILCFTEKKINQNEYQKLLLKYIDN